VNFWRRWLRERTSPRAARLARKASKRALKEARITGNRDDVIKSVLEAADIAESERDADKLRKLGDSLLRREQYEQAWELCLRAFGLEQQGLVPEWDGSDFADRSILVRYSPRKRVGEELRLSRFIAPVAQRARGCIVLAEPRLVPLLRRSFAGADVRPRGIDDDAVLAEVDVAAYYETIAFHLAKTPEEVRRSFVTLRPDPSRVASIRQRYRRILDGPLIGISWWSSNTRKDLPTLEDWAPLLRWKKAGIVSLQYGDIEHDLEVLQDLADGRMIHDGEIDQLTDLDGFAAQVAALDAVVSISNTTIDMAGMLGVPTMHICDDRFPSSWPPSGASSWYPDMVFLYKQNRSWSDVLAEAAKRLEQMAFASADVGAK
jgi:hypothetical protein